MKVTDQLLANAWRYASSFTKSYLPTPPTRQVAVVACMEAGESYVLLGFSEGDPHVIRNASDMIIDDVILSLAISQRLLGTRIPHPHA